MKLNQFMPFAHHRQAQSLTNTDLTGMTGVDDANLRWLVVKLDGFQIDLDAFANIDRRLALASAARRIVATHSGPLSRPAFALVRPVAVQLRGGMFRPACRGGRFRLFFLRYLARARRGVVQLPQTLVSLTFGLLPVTGGFCCREVRRK